MPSFLVEGKTGKIRHLRVYGAIGRSGLLGDIHGLIRLVCVARNKHGARTLMLRLPHVSAVGLLEPSRSYIEKAMCLGRGPDAVWACPLPLMYMTAEHYREMALPKTRSKRP